MKEKKRKPGRPQKIPLGASVWSVRVTDEEREVLDFILQNWRDSKVKPPGASAARRGRK